ncbi:MAG: permease [Candidatus Aminicenantes bacterium]|nr:permease [Candidatus Aminicenantes bacterium]
MKEWKIFFLMIGAFILFYFLPLDIIPFGGPVFEALALAKWYAREHVLLCLVPAFFIAGAISVFLSQDSVIKYLGPNANKLVSYGVASVSGSVLAVCSCTVLPLFSGIYKRGAGLGPATVFLYSGPAINILAIILTGQVLGWELGLARAIGAIVFSIIIGLMMHIIFLRENNSKNQNKGFQVAENSDDRSLWKNSLYFISMVGILVFANWGKPVAADNNIWTSIFMNKWLITGIFAIILIFILIKWFKKDELKEWTISSWGFTKQIMPLLLLGILAAGIFLGRPGHEGLIPSDWIQTLVGGNSIPANFFASIVGAFMYFATLTEVPILEGLMGAGMGKGPALALLLAGPALSLPNMLVIRGVLGTKKTLVFILLVIVMASISGLIYGFLF